MDTSIQKLKFFLLCGAVFPAAAVQAAETASEPLEEIVLTATRSETLLSDVGASISVMTQEELKRGQYAYAIDAIQTLPGVSINQNGGFGTQAGVSIRGNGTDQTVVLIDGVQVNDVSAPGGGFNFGSIDPATIDRIEVLKGPQSVLYGSDAIGGVVNIITKGYGAEGLGGSGFAEYGAFNTLRLGGTAHGRTDRAGFNLSASYATSDGISVADSANGNTEADGYENTTVRGRGFVALSDVIKAEVFASYIDNDADTDSSVYDPVTFSYVPADGNGVDQALSKEYLIGGRLKADLLDGRFHNTLSLEYSAIKRESVSDYGVYEGKGNRLNADYLGVFQIDDAWSLTAGAQHEGVKATSVDDNRISIDSLFGVVGYDRAGLSLSAGMRVDDHETYGSETTAQFRASYKVEDTGTRVFANWGEGFKAPTVYQLTYICTFCEANADLAPETSNADLAPETSKAWEVGFEQSLFDERVTLGATYFDQKTDHLIIYDYSIGYYNLDRARSKGVELSLDARLSDTVRFSGNYTNTSAKDRDTGDRIVQKPKHQAYAALSADVTEALSSQLSLTYNGHELDSTGYETPGWVRLDLTASYTLSDNIELYGRINNLLDKQYQEVLGYGTPGIASYFGVRLSY